MTVLVRHCRPGTQSDGRLGPRCRARAAPGGHPDGPSHGPVPVSVTVTRAAGVTTVTVLVSESAQDCQPECQPVPRCDSESVRVAGEPEFRHWLRPGLSGLSLPVTVSATAATVRPPRPRQAASGRPLAAARSLSLSGSQSSGAKFNASFSSGFGHAGGLPGPAPAAAAAPGPARPRLECRSPSRSPPGRHGHGVQ